MKLKLRHLIIAGALSLATFQPSFANESKIPLKLWAENSGWNHEWKNTDFSKYDIDYTKILSGGPPKDGIPSIDDPKFIKAKDDKKIGDNEPVSTVVINGKARAYPFRYLTFHEIVNDTFEGTPIAVTFCPLCNSAITFDRRLDGEAVEFGTTGKLHNSDLVMYDRKTESWWQQYNGKAVIGEKTGEILKMIPTRVESFKLFKERFPDSDVMAEPTGFVRHYGSNPYVGYDSERVPFLYDGTYDGPVPALSRVVSIGKKAYAISLIRSMMQINDGDIRISWSAGQNSALDSYFIKEGKDVGNVVVQQKIDGKYQDIHHLISFAFAFKAFNPDGKIIAE